MQENCSKNFGCNQIKKLIMVVFNITPWYFATFVFRQVSEIGTVGQVKKEKHTKMLWFSSWRRFNILEVLDVAISLYKIKVALKVFRLSFGVVFLFSHFAIKNEYFPSQYWPALNLIYDVFAAHISMWSLIHVPYTTNYNDKQVIVKWSSVYPEGPPLPRLS